MKSDGTGLRLLFITQLVDPQHDDLGFVHDWISEFRKFGYSVEVICLQADGIDRGYKVFTLGKGSNNRRFSWTLKFCWLSLRLRYDRVFVHMNPIYFSLMGWYWRLARIPSYLWYTHYSDHVHLKIASRVSNRMFAATDQSMPQYRKNPRRVIVGHGIDTKFWRLNNTERRSLRPETHLLMVHRLSRSKRVELGIQALAFLPQVYTLTIVGRAIDSGYFQELQDLIIRLGLERRVEFVGPKTSVELKQIYPQFSVMINMAPETIDKTMLEALRMGVSLLTTSANAIAIGEPALGVGETPIDLAQAVLDRNWSKLEKQTLANLVESKHSLEKLVRSMSYYVGPGI